MQCALRAGTEHQKLRSIGFQSQFKYLFTNGVRQILYTEDLGSKTNQPRWFEAQKDQEQASYYLSQYRNEGEMSCLSVLEVPCKTSHQENMSSTIFAPKEAVHRWGVVYGCPNWCQHIAEYSQRHLQRSRSPWLLHQSLLEIHCCNKAVQCRTWWTTCLWDNWSQIQCCSSLQEDQLRSAAWCKSSDHVKETALGVRLALVHWIVENREFTVDVGERNKKIWTLCTLVIVREEELTQRSKENHLFTPKWCKTWRKCELCTEQISSGTKVWTQIAVWTQQWCKM